MCHFVSILCVTQRYPDDVLVHHSDYDQNNYYRAFSTLPDDVNMEGVLSLELYRAYFHGFVFQNCAVATPGVGHNEMYPCIPNDNYNYGYSMTGVVDPPGTATPASLAVSDWMVLTKD
jgi:hypothetical protein